MTTTNKSLTALGFVIGGIGVVWFWTLTDLPTTLAVLLMLYGNNLGVRASR